MSEIDANDSTNSTTNDEEQTSTLTRIFKFMSAHRPTARGLAQAVPAAIFGYILNIVTLGLDGVMHTMKALDAVVDLDPLRAIFHSVAAVIWSYAAYIWTIDAVVAAKTLAAEVTKQHATKRAAAKAIARSSAPMIGLLAFGYITYYVYFKTDFGDVDFDAHDDADFTDVNFDEDEAPADD